MADLNWSPELELGVVAMDDTHREFVDHLAAAADAQDDALSAALARLIEHTVTHFAQEDHWMALSGFGPMCHVGEHRNVLMLMREVLKRVEAGDIAIGRRLVTELAPWFRHHAATMDTILASHMAQTAFDPAAHPLTDASVV